MEDNHKRPYVHSLPCVALHSKTDEASSTIMPHMICACLTEFRVLVTAPTNTLYAPTMIPACEATEAGDKADETLVVLMKLVELMQYLIKLTELMYLIKLMKLKQQMKLLKLK